MSLLAVVLQHAFFSLFVYGGLLVGFFFLLDVVDQALRLPQAVVAIYCGTSANCAGGLFSLAQSEVDVYVYYGFNDLNLFGGLITISGSSRETTSW